MTRTIRSIPRFAPVPLLAAGMALAVGACASAGAPSWTYPPAQPAADTGAAAAAPVLAAPRANAMSMSMPMGITQAAAQGAAPAASPLAEPIGGAASVNITIVTGDMIGHTEFPAFIPADITLPANSTVVVTITNFDDATALPRGSEQYARVNGTIDGTASVTPIKAAYPNGASGSARAITSLDPADVSHTLTIPGLGVNIPIAARSRETFTIQTGAPGVYAWHCMDPCGDGATGWGTAMAMRKGFMEGTIRVVG